MKFSEIRQREGLTLREMAKKTGVPHPTLWRIERGAIPSGRTLLVLQSWAKRHRYKIEWGCV